MKKMPWLLSVAAGLVAQGRIKKATPAFNVVEATIPEMRAAMAQGRITSHELVALHLIRIGLHEDKLYAAITVNRNALQEADELDGERARGNVRGPLHGIPIALKDNIHKTNMPTTGALAFAGFTPPYEATLVKNNGSMTQTIVKMFAASRHVTQSWTAPQRPDRSPREPLEDPPPPTRQARPEGQTAKMTAVSFIGLFQNTGSSVPGAAQ